MSGQSPYHSLQIKHLSLTDLETFGSRYNPVLGDIPNIYYTALSIQKTYKPHMFERLYGYDLYHTDTEKELQL